MDANIKNSFVSDGTLKIKAIKEDYLGRNFTSAKLVSKCGNTYGRYEIRAKVPGGLGVWPAIWMLPTIPNGEAWPDKGEIDIMEHIGYLPHSIFGTIHTRTYNHIYETQHMGEIHGSTWEHEFHVYALEWTPFYLKWYVNEKHYHTFYKHGGYAEWPFDKPFSLILNLAVGGNWGAAGGFDWNIWPRQFEIDYVRIYGNHEATICQNK